MDNVWITEEFMDTRYGYKVKETLFLGKVNFKKWMSLIRFLWVKCFLMTTW